MKTNYVDSGKIQQLPATQTTSQSNSQKKKKNAKSVTQKVDSVKEADVQYTIHGREGGDKGRSVNEWEKEETRIVETFATGRRRIFFLQF